MQLPTEPFAMTDTPQPKRRSDRAFWLMMATLGAMLAGLVALLAFASAGFQLDF